MSNTFATLAAGPVVGPLALIAVSTGVVTLIRRHLLTPARLLTVALATLYGAAVLTLTFFPLQIETGAYANQTSWLEKGNLIPILTIDAHSFVLNIAMMVPLGVLVPLLRHDCRWTTALGYGLAASALIETTQWLTNILVSSGRMGDVNDLIANGLGAVLGFALMRLVTARLAGPVARFALYQLPAPAATLAA